MLTLIRNVKEPGLWPGPVLPLGQLGSRLGRTPQRGAVLTFEGHSFIQITPGVASS